MMQRYRDGGTSWFHRGCEHAAHATVRRKIFSTNIGIALGMAWFGVFGLAYLLTGNAAMLQSVLISWSCIPAFALCLRVNHCGNARLAAWLFSLTVTFSLALNAAGVQGDVLGAHQPLLLCAVLPVVLFPPGERLVLAILFLLNIACFLWVEYGPVIPHPAMRELSSDYVLGMRMAFLAATSLTLLLLILVSEHASAENEARLEMVGETDGLTGIPNRRCFDSVIELDWARAIRERQSLTLLFIDVDWFKKYNDRYGHLAGDDCLRAVAGVLRSHLRRASDLVARYGGEEFVVLAPDMSLDDSRNLAESICRAIEALRVPHADSVFAYITVSIGVAVMHPKPEQSSDALIAAADAAMYIAKQEGRNRVVGCPG